MMEGQYGYDVQEIYSKIGRAGRINGILLGIGFITGGIIAGIFGNITFGQSSTNPFDMSPFWFMFHAGLIMSVFGLVGSIVCVVKLNMGRKLSAPQHSIGFAVSIIGLFIFIVCLILSIIGYSTLYSLEHMAAEDIYGYGIYSGISQIMSLFNTLNSLIVCLGIAATLTLIGPPISSYRESAITLSIFSIVCSIVPVIVLYWASTNYSLMGLYMNFLGGGSFGAPLLFGSLVAGIFAIIVGALTYSTTHIRPSPLEGKTMPPQQYPTSYVPPISPTQQMQPTPPVCPRCNKQLVYLSAYKRWYCQTCGNYYVLR